MNNLLSLEWLGEFVNVSVSKEDLAQRLSLTGAGVEHIYLQSEWLEHVVVGKIISVEPHPNADSLHVCRVDVGKHTAQIVCGGVNLFVGELVIVALPGAQVQWHGESERILIGNTTLRGVESAGMICASNEIGLGDIMPAADRFIADVSFLKNVKTGTPIITALGLGDTIFDIEATTNRPDLMSVVGIAREAVAARGAEFKKRAEPRLPKSSRALPALVLDKKLCPRYIAVKIEGIRVGESPWWIRRRLGAAGIRSINNIVDITNYVRLELGQPMHAFDATKINKKIVVRRASDGETFVALDDTKHVLTKEMLVIADDENALAVAGVMGGKESAVSEETTSIIFEAAAFDGVSVRRTARTLGLYSDSQLLFEKGLSTEAPVAAMARVVELALEIAGGAVVGVADISASAYKHLVFPFDFARVESFVGEKISLVEMKRILASLGFTIKGAGTKVKIHVPTWRDHDIESPVDFIEEIARVYGYHNLPSSLPVGRIPERHADVELVSEKELREFFATRGFHETYTYSFLSEEDLRRSELERALTVAIQNPLSSEYTHMRPSLIPSLLRVIAENEPNFPAENIFEVSNVYHPVKNESAHEELRLAAAVWSPEKNGVQFFALKGAVQHVCDEWGIENIFANKISKINPLFHPGRQITLEKNGSIIGTLGEIHPLILKQFGISGRVAMLDASVGLFTQQRAHGKKFKAPAIFPIAKRDVAFVVDERITYAAITQMFESFDLKLTSFELFDIFRGTSIGVGKKSFAFHISYSLPDRTLAAEEVEIAHSNLVAMLVRNFGAVPRE